MYCINSCNLSGNTGAQANMAAQTFQRHKAPRTRFAL